VFGRRPVQTSVATTAMLRYLVILLSFIRTIPGQYNNYNTTTSFQTLPFPRHSSTIRRHTASIRTASLDNVRKKSASFLIKNNIFSYCKSNFIHPPLLFRITVLLLYLLLICESVGSLGFDSRKRTRVVLFSTKFRPSVGCTQPRIQ
jgi:hypothetical protein